MEFINLVFWLFVALCLLAPAAFGIYLLVAPEDQIYECWVRFRQRHSQLALKDEHFKAFPKQLAVARVASFFFVILCGVGLYLLFMNV